ncbi:hypothetical protein [Legionella londiniensis]|uniref:Uncharacterized protein n=1 Tax=Legionella londiniensis TaxID=45068 RepID=A0A0W0VJB0_9GAMM|nr:hypothetical protein [Legionella londiniensis]KTD20192.1 hypothetical protein Llon_1813 [Legionella londiniensis]STX94359.1 Uncharacterised protein [Legionella londiniensis]
MEPMDEQDISRLKALLQRTGEFIAYFELAESKMIEWRQEIESQALSQQKQVQTLHRELNKLQEILDEAGLARLRLAAENALGQGKAYLEAVQETKKDIMAQLNAYQEELKDLCANTLSEINQHAKQAIERVDSQLSHYDAKHFSRIANESCTMIEKSAQEAISSSRKLLSLFHWRIIAIAFFTTLITAFIMGLYLSNEYPWDIHQQAMNERDAGKLLIKSWPILSQAERMKILGNQPG